jgi:hypothetical protein
MIKSCVRISLVITAVVVAALPLRGSAQGHGQAEQRYRWDPNSIEWRDVKPIEAPVPLNLRHKNRELVRLGSYLVNVVGGCNDCHSAGPQTQFARGGNPFFGQPVVVNQETYLGGGRSFGSLVPGTPPIVSRNLTPDRYGRPGGHSYAEFLYTFRTGTDLDHAHPPCAATVAENCLPPPFNGDLMQIMPWPEYQDIPEVEVRAMYEYLSAIPCIAGPPAPSVLHNDCI